MSEDKRSSPKTQITATRLALFRLGYRIIPTYGKIARLKGWHSAEFVTRELNEKRITSWERRYPELQSTGVRLDLGLGAIDGDVDDPELAGAALAAVTAAAPRIVDCAPMRYGKSEHKFALFVRIEGEAFPRMESRYYLRPEALAAWQAERAAAAKEAVHTGEKPRRVLDPPTHKIEIFSGRPAANGNCTRHFGVAGPHSYNDDGTVAANYSWADGPTLENTPLAELPSLSAAQASAIIDAFDAAAVELGWVALPKAVSGNHGVAYDITDATRFDTNKGGEQIDYDELCAEYALYGSALRCSASFLPGRGGEGNRSHCVVGDDNRHGCVAVHVFGDDCTHFPAELEPPSMDTLMDDMAFLREARTIEGETDPPERPDDSVDLRLKADWLLKTYGYCAANYRVVELFKASNDCELDVKAFRHLYLPWRLELEDGPRGGKRTALATSVWDIDAKRINIEGVRMRPDRPFPLYEEDGLRYKNTYRRPRHEGAQNNPDFCAPFTAFMERFLPDPVEREWLYDWMAHKQLRPEIPGTAVVFVADNEEGGVRDGTYGTGRGTLSEIVRLLYGPQYVIQQAFSMLEGSNGQSTFNDWMHGNVLVTVDEAKTSATAHRRGERSATYEVLKDLVDTGPKQHTFRGKYRRGFSGMSYCSFWVFTNHANALSIPEHDRRFTVLRNGRKLTPEEVRTIRAWMVAPGAIAVLSAMLAARDLSAFNMFDPLETVAKTEMAELARSDVEELLRDMMADDSLGKAFTKAHLEQAIGSNYNGQGTYWIGEFKAVWHKYCGPARVPSGTQRRVRVYSKQKKVFCFRVNLRAVEHMPDAALRREVAKWGGVDPETKLSEVSGLASGLTEKDNEINE